MPQKKAAYNIDFDLFTEQVSKRIVSIRKKTGLAQDAFAIKYGFNRRQFQRMETAEPISMHSLFKFLKAIDMPPSEFFSEGFD